MDPNVALLLAKMNLLATAVLVIITGWYAYSTWRILREMKDQADATREQSTILAKSAQVYTLAALIDAAAHPTGEEPIPKLRTLLKEFEEFIAERIKPTTS